MHATAWPKEGIELTTQNFAHEYMNMSTQPHLRRLATPLICFERWLQLNYNSRN